MPGDLTRQPDTDPTSLMRYRDGLYAVDLITAALVHLDFYTWLSKHPGDLKSICNGLNITERPADVLISLSAAHGLVCRNSDGTISVTDRAREYFVKGSPYFLGPYYESLKDRPVTLDFVNVLQTGKPAAWGGSEEGDEKDDWHEGMLTDDFANMFTAAMNCRGTILGQALAADLDLTRRGTVLDIGGGSGIYSCALCAANPELRGIVMEQAPVDDLARRTIADYGLAERISVATGDMFRDPLPDNCDVHLFSNVLHDWNIQEVRQLLARSAAAMPPGGLIIIHEVFLNREKTGPLPAAEYSAILMHSTQGRCYGIGEIEELLGESGFSDIYYRETVADRGYFTALRVD